MFLEQPEQLVKSAHIWSGVEPAQSDGTQVLFGEHQAVRKTNAGTAPGRLRYGHQLHPVNLHRTAQIG